MTTPAYEVIHQDGDFEIRRYESMIVAQVEVSGERKEAINHGFRQLADYIFGNNIAMTAPVTQKISEKIPMTAPVLQQSSEQNWRVSFIMPPQYTLQTLPKPNNQKIELKQLDKQAVIAIRFSGHPSKSAIEANLNKLNAYIKKENIQIKGQAIYAFYDPPFTLPQLRRNEIFYEIIETDETKTLTAQ